MRLLTTGVLFFVVIIGWSQQISISENSGKFSDTALMVSITGDFEQVFYTLNGETPSKSSKKYKQPIKISKTTFLRVKPVFKSDTIEMLLARSYIFDFETTLPILSIGVDNKHFWDESTGIYAKGKRAYQDSTGHWKKCNYQQKWERPIHVVYLDTNNQEGFNQQCGIIIFGESTRKQADKSMKIIARSSYGESRFRYKIFPQKDISEHKQLVIRTSGNDYRNTRFKDVLNAYLARNLGLDYMAYQPVQLFINGEYWGLYNLREKVNEHYLYYNHGAHKDSSSIIMGRWVRQHGSSKDYMKMYNWFLKLDNMDDEAYEKAGTMLDIRNYINFRIYQIYMNNVDSRGNIRYWNSKDMDGKFRMILYDTDHSFGQASRKYLEKCLSPTRTDWFNPEWSTFYLRKLMQNDQFKHDFVNQFAHIMNTSLQTDTIIEAVDSFENLYKDELPRNGKILAPHLKTVPIGEKEWLKNVNQFRMFAKMRPPRIRPEITRILAPEGIFYLKVAGDTGAVSINNNYVQNIPFEGVYFKGIPLPVEAVAEENWHFVKWSDGDTLKVKVLNAHQDTVVIKPLFEYVEPVVEEVKIEEPVEVITSEIDTDEILLWIGYGLLLLGGFLFLTYLVLRIAKV